MNKQDFYNEIKNNETMILATSDGNVIMRTISPVYCDEKILFFTDSNSTKYKQLQKNNNCCISIGNFFLEAKAEFCGSTMSEENKNLRDIYSKKFPNAFDEDIEFGGRTSDFILLTPIKLTGWNYENGIPTTPIFIEF